MAIRCLVVGWDAADKETVEDMLRAGDLPVLQSVRQRGVSGTIEALAGLGDDAHWATFVTGMPPGEHGRFHHRQTAPDSYDEVPFRRSQMTLPPFWQTLSAEGSRVAILDVPKSPIADTPGCRQVVDWMPHGEDNAAPSGSPPAIVADVARRFPAKQLSECHEVVVDAASIEAIFGTIMSRLAARTRLLTEWSNEQDWDLLMAVFAESHCVGHHAWHVHDRSHSEHLPLVSGVDPVRTTYIGLDRALGQLMEAAGPEAAVVVFSLIGMGSNYSGTPLLDEVLRRLEPTLAGAAGSRGLGSRAGSRMPRVLRRFLPRSARRAYAVHHDAISGAIRLNLKGREPHGRVAPGAEYAVLCDTLEQELRQLVDPHSGHRLVMDVVRVRERYPGPKTDAFADLLVVWDQRAPIRAASSERVGVVSAPSSPQRTGNHRPGGWFVTNRPHVLAATTPSPVRVVEIGLGIGSLLAPAVTPPLRRR